jgi:probable phosphoglycerate mutase
MSVSFLAAALCVLAAEGDPLATLEPPAPGTVRVYAVRHGQAKSNLDPQPDLPAAQLDHLTPLGHEQARAAGHALAGRGVTLVLTSPARRARETASEIRAVLGRAALRIDLGLRPLELGRSTTGEPLVFDDRLAEWKAGRDPTPPRGESLAQVGRRVLAVASRLARRGHRGGVVFVAHSEVIASFLGEAEGKPGAARYPPGVRNGSISVVDVPASGAPRLLLTDHLPETAAVPAR